ncbi:MAG: hypothetical protein AAFX81_06675 [Pseudomonadota bacterium]
MTARPYRNLIAVTAFALVMFTLSALSATSTLPAGASECERDVVNGGVVCEAATPAR